ncbi:peptidoglycan DD-metalloendopeptidase family protein [Rhodoferax sp.]|uniref:peptidoglycan DD-metalloendopeptidase family protein n=1 Tax=Rhodoferax sp. TaxID=50421 RepID=UPI00276A7DF9|nr:peptidoglycan DD-metalloendopeptidase family protein [Rhodoferax sp.]
MSGSLGRGGLLASALVGVLLSAGCSFRTLNQAPVEDRGSSLPRPVTVTSPTTGAEPAAGTVKPTVLSDNAGKPGYYTVRPGDTLIRIGLDSGQNWRDVARWNGMENPNQLEVGQVLRVVPPVAVAVAAVTTPTVAGARPLPSSPVASVVVTPVPEAAAAKSPGSAPASVVASAATAGEDDMGWIWPANGAVLAGFDELKNKGVDIGGAAGDAVVAAADGRVVYAGAGLRGYGNLIILKHNNTYLTAYAHNQTLLAKEDQAVRKGQKIAEMGNSDADRVKLHFEVRRQGKPVDPVKYLPLR